MDQEEFSMNELLVFNFEEKRKVRSLLRGDEPWFMAPDACGILGLTNVTKSLQTLDDDEKDVITRANDPNHWLGSFGNEGQKGGAQSVNIVNEPGLYRLIFQSKKPEAKAFKRWVFHEVLPSIRKTGEYRMNKRAAVYRSIAQFGAHDVVHGSERPGEECVWRALTNGRMYAFKKAAGRWLACLYDKQGCLVDWTGHRSPAAVLKFLPIWVHGYPRVGEIPPESVKSPLSKTTKAEYLKWLDGLMDSGSDVLSGIADKAAPVA
jgi:prophage antirepressor-like protein